MMGRKCRSRVDVVPFSQHQNWSRVLLEWIRGSVYSSPAWNHLHRRACVQIRFCRNKSLRCVMDDRCTLSSCKSPTASSPSSASAFPQAP